MHDYFLNTLQLDFYFLFGPEIIEVGDFILFLCYYFNTKCLYILLTYFKINSQVYFIEAIEQVCSYWNLWWPNICH